VNCRLSWPRCCSAAGAGTCVVSRQSKVRGVGRHACVVARARVCVRCAGACCAPRARLRHTKPAITPRLQPRTTTDREGGEAQVQGYAALLALWVLVQRSGRERRGQRRHCSALLWGTDGGRAGLADACMRRGDRRVRHAWWDTAPSVCWVVSCTATAVALQHNVACPGVCLWVPHVIRGCSANTRAGVPRYIARETWRVTVLAALLHWRTRCMAAPRSCCMRLPLTQAGLAAVHVPEHAHIHVQHCCAAACAGVRAPTPPRTCWCCALLRAAQKRSAMCWAAALRHCDANVPAQRSLAVHEPHASCAAAMISARPGDL
jgi:hypothetical protein